ncbi:MAG: hypothetical protein RH948_18060, partial [Cyclobacteriaceae bacterium]
ASMNRQIINWVKKYFVNRFMSRLFMRDHIFHLGVLKQAKPAGSETFFSTKQECVRIVAEFGLY